MIDREKVTLVHFDVESCSEVELGDCGAYYYARHPSTRMLCISFMAEKGGKRGAMQRWRPGDRPPVKLFQAIEKGAKVVAHNCAFDAEMWRCVLTERHGWDWPGYDAFLDSMACAMLVNLPAKLDDCSRFFRGMPKKDRAGHELMLKMCKPRNITKNLKDPWRNHTPENLARLEDYCDDDVRAEAGFLSKIPLLNDFEEGVWRATWRMNRNGVYVDTDLVDRLQGLVDQVRDRYRTRLQDVTGGLIQTEGQRKTLGPWLQERGVFMPQTEAGSPSFAKGTFDEIDTSVAEPEAIQALELYGHLNSSSIAKLNKMEATLCPDGRIRGMTAYSGAGQTGRWAGREVQLQNIPRPMPAVEADYDGALALIRNGTDLDEVESIYGSAMDYITSLLRPCLCAAPGKTLLCADYSAIEGRVLAWSAGEQHVLDAYEAGLRLYAVAAAGIFGCSYEQVKQEKADGDSTKDAIGKVAELACGYQGSIGAFLLMGGKKLGLTEVRIKEIVQAWRADRKATVAYWYDLERAAMDALKNPGSRYEVGPVAFRYNGRDLHMRLPTGRSLWYRKARIGEKVWPDGGTSPQIEYYGTDSRTKAVGWQSIYGGLLSENATQAIARELLAYATLQLESEGYHLVMTVHDELVAEVDEQSADLEKFCEIMRRKPDWAKDLPIGVEGWVGTYYRK